MSHRTTDPATAPSEPPDPTDDPAVPAVPASSTVAAGSAVAAPQRILVVGDDHRVRGSLADLIGLADGVQIVGTTSRPAETLEALARLAPGVVVVDPYLPDLPAGLDLIGALRASGHVLRIVVTCRDAGLDAIALAAGADACVDWCADPVALHEAVVAAADPRGEPEGGVGRPGEPGQAVRPGRRGRGRRSAGAPGRASRAPR